MKKSQYIKQRRIQQRNLERATCKNLVWHIIIITIIMIIALCNMPRVIAEKEDASKVSESYSNKTTTPYVSNLVTFEPQTEEESSEIEVDYYPEFTYSKDWSAKESYLLARIAMAEAEGCNTQTKTLIIMCVLNRVWSDEFPDTIEEVIFQENQFSPIDNGRWDRVEPNEDCYEAVKVVMEAKYDYSGGATYFENCADEDNWHSRNLEFLYESEGIRFYK
jgi:N-acetylmuramoyl-L-alanine amidase|nr:MAG TPA: lytic transglycosylase [Caudoviricetes sp.]